MNCTSTIFELGVSAGTLTFLSLIFSSNGEETALPHRDAGSHPQVRVACTELSMGPETPSVCNTLAVDYCGANGFSSPSWEKEVITPTSQTYEGGGPQDHVVKKFRTSPNEKAGPHKVLMIIIRPNLLPIWTSGISLLCVRPQFSGSSDTALAQPHTFPPEHS